MRCHLDRKIGNFLLQLLVAADLNGSSQKTCKDDDDVMMMMMQKKGQKSILKQKPEVLDDEP